MSYAEAVRVCLNKYIDFTGRARRSEYWWWILFVVVIDIVTSIIDSVLGTSIFYILGALALLLPSIAVGVRRMHDIGKSGWYLLIGLIPLVGWIIVIIWAATDSWPETNEWGPSPKAQSV